MNQRQLIDFPNIRHIFLDRDGVLNRKPPEGQYVTCWAEFVLLPGVETAIAQLNRSDRKVIVVTNQRGIARGLYSQDDLALMHERLQHCLAKHGAHLDAIYVCPHEEGQCECRKPRPGLFQQAFRDFPEAVAEHSLMAGDSLRDIEAAVRLGMPSVLISSGAERASSEEERAAQLARLSVASLPELVRLHLCPSDDV